MYGSNLSAKPSWTSESTDIRVLFVLISLQTLFTKSFFLAIVALAGKHKKRCVPEEDAIPGTVGIFSWQTTRGSDNLKHALLFDKRVEQRFSSLIWLSLRLVRFYHPPVLLPWMLKSCSPVPSNCFRTSNTNGPRWPAAFSAHGFFLSYESRLNNGLLFKYSYLVGRP